MQSIYILRHFAAVIRVENCDIFVLTSS